MIFNLNYYFLVKNNNAEKINLNFAICQYLIAIKVNKKWQQKLLNNKSIYIIKAILLITIIF